VILVDTSVWIRFFQNQPPFADDLDSLLSRGEVSGHELVYGELLIGDSGGRTRFLEGYEKMHHARTVPHTDVVAFVRHRRLHGRGIGWLDVHLLASAIMERQQIWTADARLAQVAAELAVGWRRESLH
jgi:predicted nucleic acid-binding protein